MPDALAWTAEQVFRTADLPNREVKAVAPRASGLAVKAAVDKTWRCRAEIARIAGVDQSTAGRMLALMLSTRDWPISTSTRGLAIACSAALMLM